jgi:hypothetical protein
MSRDWPFPTAAAGMTEEDLRSALGALEADLAEARVAGNQEEESNTLMGLVHVTYRLRLYDHLMRYADEAWRLAQSEDMWNVLGRLARFFGDVSLRAREFTSSSDHYANACAYALLHNQDALWETVRHIDSVAEELRLRSLTMPARDLYTMLGAYEEAGGLGGRVPEFSEHVRNRQQEAERWIDAA